MNCSRKSETCPPVGATIVVIAHSFQRRRAARRAFPTWRNISLRKEGKKYQRPVRPKLRGPSGCPDSHWRNTSPQGRERAMARREWVLLDDPTQNRFVAPAYLLNDSIHVLVVGAGGAGGGGGGGGNNSNGSGGAGGGAAGSVVAATVAVKPNAVLRYHLGVAGRGGPGGAPLRRGSDGSAGGDTVFDNITAKGGAPGRGGRYKYQDTGGQGGSGPSGDGGNGGEAPDADGSPSGVGSDAELGSSARGGLGGSSGGWITYGTAGGGGGGGGAPSPFGTGGNGQGGQPPEENVFTHARPPLPTSGTKGSGGGGGGGCRTNENGGGDGAAGGDGVILVYYEVSQ